MSLHGGTLNSRQAVSPHVRLVEEEERIRKDLAFIFGERGGMGGGASFRSKLGTLLLRCIEVRQALGQIRNSNQALSPLIAAGPMLLRYRVL
ncbi:hypothetical protein TNCV_4628371 [Trichonephila clavipes]|nr:hypothetical protein TNCV_4628371 [Trichonephila clavipes]